MPKQNFDGCIEITLQGSNREVTSAKDIINLPIKSPVSSSVESLKKVWNDYMNSSEELYCVFDGFLLEDQATLVGLGVVGGDSVLVFPKRDGAEQLLDIQMKRRSAEEISVGLNVLIGEDEGLEVLELLEQESSFLESEAPVFSRKMSLFDNDENVRRIVQSHCLDIDKLRENFVNLVYYQENSWSLSSSPDYLLLQQKNYDTLREHRQEIFQALHRFWLHHYQLPDSLNIDYETVFIGPERNASFSNYLAFPPTVQLRGVSWTTTLRDLLESYQEYSGCNIHTHNQLFFNNESYSLQERVFDVYIESLSRLSVLPSHQHFSFSFDISTTEDLRCVDDLVNFIEGGDEVNSEGRKKKKKRKKKGQNEDYKDQNLEELAEELKSQMIQDRESRTSPPELPTEIIEKTIREEPAREMSRNIVNELGQKIGLTKLEALKKEFEFEIEREKRNLEENDRNEKRLVSMRERDARLIVQIRQVDQDISNISNGISSCDSEIHDLEIRLKRVKLLKEKLSERQSEKMRRIRLLEEEKRNLTQNINSEAGRAFEERTKIYNRIDELKKKLLSAIKDIEDFDQVEVIIFVIKYKCSVFTPSPSRRECQEQETAPSIERAATGYYLRQTGCDGTVMTDQMNDIFSREYLLIDPVQGLEST